MTGRGEQALAATTGERTWVEHRLVATALRVGVVLVPFAAAALAGQVVARLVPRPSGPLLAAWLLVVFGASLAALVGVDRLCRRLLPLAALLRLTLVFPDRAPSRFAIALRAGSVGRLKAWAATTTVDEDPTEHDAATTVLTLAAALNAHDRRTRGHSERVRAFAELIGEELHLTPADANRLRWSALLHDIGKMTVPAEILNKAGRPDASEWAVLSRHPGEGGRLAAPLRSLLGDWFGGIDEHHERWDGTGYPRGLAGREISLAGRIVAVADAFETMTSARSYKRSIPIAEARTEIERCAGSHFDPAVSRAFLNLSLPRLRLAVGPLALLAQVPILGLVAQTYSGVAAAATSSATTAGAVAGTAALVLSAGAVRTAPDPPAPTARRGVRGDHHDHDVAR